MLVEQLCFSLAVLVSSHRQLNVQPALLSQRSWLGEGASVAKAINQSVDQSINQSIISQSSTSLIGQAISSVNQQVNPIQSQSINIRLLNTKRSPNIT